LKRKITKISCVVLLSLFILSTTSLVLAQSSNIISITPYQSQGISVVNMYNGYVTKIGQTFTVTTSTQAYSAMFWFEITGNPTGNIASYIYIASGTLPTGSPIGSSNSVSFSTLGSALGNAGPEYTFNFITPISLSVGTTYCVTIELDNSGVTDSSNYVTTAQNDQSLYTGGSMCYSLGSWSQGVSVSADLAVTLSSQPQTQPTPTPSYTAPTPTPYNGNPTPTPYTNPTPTPYVFPTPTAPPVYILGYGFSSRDLLIIILASAVIFGCAVYVSWSYTKGTKGKSRKPR